MKVHLYQKSMALRKSLTQGEQNILSELPLLIKLGLVNQFVKAKDVYYFKCFCNKIPHLSVAKLKERIFD